MAKGRKRGKPTFRDPEKARAAARKRWEASSSKFDPAIAKYFEASGVNAEALKRLKRLEGQAHPPSSSAPAGSTTPPAGSTGDLTDFAGAANAEQPGQIQESAREDSEQGQPAPTSERCDGCGRRWKLSESPARREAHAKERGDRPGLSDDERAMRARCRAWLAAPVQDPREAHRRELDQERKRLATVAREKARVQRRAAPPAPAAPPASGTGGVVPVILSKCTVCEVTLRATTKYGIDERQRAHLADSEACRRWADERQVSETFDQSVAHVPASEHAELQKIEPIPPPPSAEPTVGPRHHGRVVDVIHRNFFDPPPDAGGFPTSTVASKEEFFSRPDD